MSTPTKISSRVSLPTVISGLIAGLQKDPPAGAKSVSVLGDTLTVPQTNLRPAGHAADGAGGHRCPHRPDQGGRAAKGKRTSTRAFVTALKKALIYLYGSDVEGLEECGIGIKQRAPLTSDQRSIAKARALATCAANGTGKKPKKAGPTITRWPDHPMTRYLSTNLYRVLTAKGVE